MLNFVLSRKRKKTYYSRADKYSSSKFSSHFSCQGIFKSPERDHHLHCSSCRSFSSLSASSSDSKKKLICYGCDQTGHSVLDCSDYELILRLLRKYKRKSASRSTSQRSQSCGNRPKQRSSLPENSRKGSKSVRFSKRFQAYLIDSETDSDGDLHIAKQTISDESDSDNQTCIAVEIVSPSADVGQISTQTCSLDIDEISLIVFQSKSSSSVWIYDSGTTTHMTDQIDIFESDLTVNESGKHKIMMNDRTLSIKERDTINVKLLYSNLRLYNVLFVSHLDANLLFFSYIVSKDFYAVYDHK